MSGRHTCHVRACRAPCPPRHLTCARCWADVPPGIATEVYRTVKLRGAATDETWAPWWRAQARAIDAILHAGVVSGRWAEAYPGAFALELKDALAFADYLERKITYEQLEAVQDERRRARPRTGDPT